MRFTPFKPRQAIGASRVHLTPSRRDVGYTLCLLDFTNIREVDLALGAAEATILGGDLTHEYVSENADYRS